MFGMMVAFMRVNGRITRCMEKENLDGKMADVTKDNFYMIKSMEKDVSNGQMAEYLKVIG